MFLRFTLLTVIVLREITLIGEAHAWTMLPDFTQLALHHEVVAVFVG